MTFTATRRTTAAAAVLAGLGLVTVVGAGAAQAAPAGSTKTTSTIKLADQRHLTGNLRSAKPVCKNGRTVSLHYKAPGTKAFTIVARDVSNAKGFWSIKNGSSTIPSGRYYVTTPANATCARGRSVTIGVR